MSHVSISAEESLNAVAWAYVFPSNNLASHVLCPFTATFNQPWRLIAELSVWLLKVSLKATTGRRSFTSAITVQYIIDSIRITHHHKALRIFASIIRCNRFHFYPSPSQSWLGSLVSHGPPPVISASFWSASGEPSNSDKYATTVTFPDGMAFRPKGCCWSRI